MTLGNVRRGVAQCGTLGYWMGEKYAGQGYMAKAVRALLRHAFLEMGLHRIEAACAPDNERSRRLLERLGFQREGYARAYLLIDGAWQDHLLFAMLERRFFARGRSAEAPPTSGRAADLAPRADREVRGPLAATPRRHSFDIKLRQADALAAMAKGTSRPSP